MSTGKHDVIRTEQFSFCSLIKMTYAKTSTTVLV